MGMERCRPGVHRSAPDRLIELRRAVLGELSRGGGAGSAELVDDDGGGGVGEGEGIVELGVGGDGGGKVGGDRVAGADDVDLAVDGQGRQVDDGLVWGGGEDAAFGQGDEHGAPVCPSELQGGGFDRVERGIW
jgi:hypothetical protein